MSDISASAAYNQIHEQRRISKSKKIGKSLLVPPPRTSAAGKDVYSRDEFIDDMNFICMKLKNMLIMSTTTMMNNLHTICSLILQINLFLYVIRIKLVTIKIIYREEPSFNHEFINEKGNLPNKSNNLTTPNCSFFCRKKAELLYDKYRISQLQQLSW